MTSADFIRNGIVLVFLLFLCSYSRALFLQIHYHLVITESGHVKAAIQVHDKTIMQVGSTTWIFCTRKADDLNLVDRLQFLIFLSPSIAGGCIWQSAAYIHIHYQWGVHDDRADNKSYVSGCYEYSDVIPVCSFSVVIALPGKLKKKKKLDACPLKIVDVKWCQ